uniref:Putative secreted protein n=1 Tax=Anopheles marajoara TaxID=58244 RepID=A0A2M4CER9_9DIPT
MPWVIIINFSITIQSFRGRSIFSLAATATDVPDGQTARADRVKVAAAISWRNCCGWCTTTVCRIFLRP